MLVTCAGDNLIGLLKVVKGNMDVEGNDSEKYEVISKVEGHKLDVNCVAFNPVYTDILASCSDDRTIKLWKINLEK